MSWESIASREYHSGNISHQLSATALLASPDGSRHPLDLYDYNEEDFSGSPARRRRQLGGNRGLWECLLGCRYKVDQQLARRRVEQGLRLYNQHKQQAAVRKWQSALKCIRKPEDKFTLLGYLFQAYMDWGKYRESLEFAHRQLGLAEEADSSHLRRAEAYLNLSRAHQRLGGLQRALSYARHSLYNECDQWRTTAGHVHLTVGSVYLELACFCKALEAFQHAHKIAQAIEDSALELQVYVGVSELFGRLQDADKSACHAAKAYDLSRSSIHLNTRHHRAALLQMATALRKQGELGDAHDYCSEATRLALVSGDQATYARSMRIMGDIYRKKSDINKAYRQYESSMGSAASMGDRLCQMEAMDGAARCLEALRLQQKICNCRPLEFNTRLLEVASSIGAKLLVRTVRVRLSLIYKSLGDEEQQLMHERLAQNIEEDLELQCGACSSPFGLEADSLEALPCSHILHARCAHELLRSRSSKKKKRICPDCHKSVSSRLYLHCDDTRSVTSSYSANSVSLRASSLSLYNHHHATSSV